MSLKKMIIYLFILILVVFLIYLVWYFNHTFSYEKVSIQIGNHIIEADLADSIAKRTRGLSGRKQLSENDGMLFIFPYKARYSFWMKDMNFPIDIIWINDNKIVGVEESVNPQINEATFDLKMYDAPEPINNVLELPAGSFQKWNFKIGDSVKIEN